ncbi:type Iii polyketide Synthase [Mycena metata]|uniref:Type Iii polyketide Synthase n=1 Tax=Mycena metata TaxID=1033252 RepID=A0AAD7MQF2_9AGAR|nr:type Iii polyketide Synthase [Mycena metata]
MMGEHSMQADTTCTMTPPPLRITGFGVAYPSNLVPTVDLDKLAYKWHKPSPALDKVLAINRRTGIKTHSLIHPLEDLPYPPSIKEVSEIFLKEGVTLAVSAARSAIDEAGLVAEEITHVVSTTCTNSSNPGFDVFLAQELGLRPSVEKVLLHGVGCAGGLAALRLAASLCQAAAWRGETAHVLVAACEITSSMRRDELERISRDQEIRIGVTLFGDGASALILSFNPEGGVCSKVSKGIYELVNWTHLTVPDTHSDLRIDVDASGFKPTLSARIPSLTAPCTPLLYDTLLKTLPNKSAMRTLPSEPKDFDWAVHPGGAAILSAIQNVMKIEKDHMKASWEVYENHGNTSSVTVLSVLDTLRRQPGREWVMSVAFGPGVAAEGSLLRRIA